MAADDMELGDRSVADLLRQASDQTATLVRQEFELAKAELTVKGSRSAWVPACSAAPAYSASTRSER